MGATMAGTICRPILIVEDEPRIAHWLKVRFERAGFSAEVAHDGRSGLALARASRPHLIVLDLMLPRLDGMQVCRILRGESAVPIIMLTARETHADRIAGLDCGADDYVVKPFDPDEVVARAKAVLRRVHDTVQQVLTCGTITIDETTYQVMVDGRPIELSHALSRQRGAERAAAYRGRRSDHACRSSGAGRGSGDHRDGRRRRDRCGRSATPVRSLPHRRVAYPRHRWVGAGAVNRPRHRHRATITITSAGLGQGTTVRISLPRASRPRLRGAEPIAREIAAEHRGRSVALVTRRRAREQTRSFGSFLPKWT